MGQLNFLGDTGLVAGREIRERVRGKVFLVVTIILFAVVAAAVVIPAVHLGKTTWKVGVVNSSAALDAQLQETAKSIGLSVKIAHEQDLTQARSAVSSGALNMVADQKMVLLKDPLSSSDTSKGASYVRTVSAALGERQAYIEAGLTSQQATTVSRAKPVPVKSIHPVVKSRTTAEATALLGVILTFIILTQYLTWTLMGVMEEKANRVVEVLLATVRPIQLLAGKVIGIGFIAMAQAVTLVAFALVLADLVGSSIVHGAAPLVVVSSLVWLILGYAFYSWAYAAAGSMAERQDQIQSLALPLSAPLIFGYIVSLVGVSSGHATVLVKVLAYLPPTAPFAMPTLVGFGAVAWWQFSISIAISIGCTVLIALGAAQVYRKAILRTGGRVRLRGLVENR